MNDEGSATRRAPQDDLANRERPARQRRRLGLQDVRARHAVLPIHLGEPDRVPERARAQGRLTRLRLRHARGRGRRVRPTRDGGREGLLHPSQRAVRQRSASRQERREPQRDARSGCSRNIEGSAVGSDSEYDLKGLFDDLDVNSSKLGSTVAKRNEKLVKLLDAIGDLALGDFADNTIDAFGDAYEYLMTMYASSAGKSGGEFFTPQEVSELLARITVVGKTGGEQGVRPGVRLGLAAAAVREGARPRQRPPGVLRSGDQPDHLQPVPDQHVPA